VSPPCVGEVWRHAHPRGMSDYVRLTSFRVERVDDLHVVVRPVRGGARESFTTSHFAAQFRRVDGDEEIVT
jgi:hypothetical protein